MIDISFPFVDLSTDQRKNVTRKKRLGKPKIKWNSMM